MSGIGRRLRDERDLWKAMWQQVETYLDRVDGAADQDEPHVVTLCALLPVLAVVEAARVRAYGYGLTPALPAVPRGVGLTIGSFQPDPARMPGVEETELAVALVGATDDDDFDVRLWPTVDLATFRDAKRHLDGVRRVPTYDNGRLAVMQNLGDVTDDGLFPSAQREKAVNGEAFAFTKWSQLRADRFAAVEADRDTATDIPLSAQLRAITTTDPLAAVEDIGDAAAVAAAACTRDRATLATARAQLEDIGADAALLGALRGAEDELATQATRYASVARQLSPPHSASFWANRDAIEDELARADAPSGVGLPPSLLAVDVAASRELDKAAEARIAYPDGPLRMLRMLEQGLRFYWPMRVHWIQRRAALITDALMAQFFAPFVASVADVLAGRPSGLVLPATTTTTRAITARARTVHVDGIPLPATFQPGRLARAGGPRPATLVVVDEGLSKEGLRLAVSPVEVSLATDDGIGGVPGLVEAGTRLDARFPAWTAAELRRGAADSGRGGDALLWGFVAHASRLALVRGAAAAAVPAPYPAIAAFALEGPVGPTSSRLFLAQVPAADASGTGERLAIARPGELMLVRGVDDDGFVWQGVAEIDRCEILSGADAARDDAISSTPAPACCVTQPEVMVVYVRTLELPSTLTRAITLRRDFLGFGNRSLLCAKVLPGAPIDADTETPHVTVDGASTQVLRDPELAVAVRVFEDWLGPDGGRT